LYVRCAFPRFTQHTAQVYSMSWLHIYNRLWSAFGLCNFIGHLTLGDETNTLSRNVGYLSTNGATLRSGRTKASTSPLRKPKNSPLPFIWEVLSSNSVHGYPSVWAGSDIFCPFRLVSGQHLRIVLGHFFARYFKYIFRYSYRSTMCNLSWWQPRSKTVMKWTSIRIGQGYKRIQICF